LDHDAFDKAVKQLNSYVTSGFKSSCSWSDNLYVENYVYPGEYSKKWNLKNYCEFMIDRCEMLFC